MMFVFNFYDFLKIGRTNVIFYFLIKLFYDL